MQEYKKEDADIRTFLENVKKGKYLREHMMDQCVFQVLDDYYLMFITEEHTVYINIKEKSVIWVVDTASLSKAENSLNGITITLDDHSKVEMLIPEEDDINAVLGKLLSVIKAKVYLKKH